MSVLAAPACNSAAGRQVQNTSNHVRTSAAERKEALHLTCMSIAPNGQSYRTKIGIAHCCPDCDALPIHLREKYPNAQPTAAPRIGPAMAQILRLHSSFIASNFATSRLRIAKIGRASCRERVTI